MQQHLRISRLTTFLRAVCLSALLLLLTGCRSTEGHWNSAITHFEAGRPTAALSELDSIGDRQLDEAGRIDRSILQLMNGTPQPAEAALLKSRRQLEFLTQKDITEQARSILTDDHAVAWNGRPVERRMVDSLVVLASLAGDRRDAFAHASQTMDLVYNDFKTLQPSAEARTKIMVAGYSVAAEEAASSPPPPSAPARHAANALATYLHALVSSESPLNTDVVQRDLRQLSYWSPNVKLHAPLGTETRVEHGTLHVLTFCGRIAKLQPETAAPTSASLLLADQILSAGGNHSLPPTIAPVRIARPSLDKSLHPFRTIVQVGSSSESTVHRSTPLLDLNSAAHDSYRHDRDQQIARAVARRIVKKGAVYAAKDQLAVSGGSGTDLLLNVGGIVWEALEKPDLRQLRCLPSLIEATQLELPVGTHQVLLNSARNNGTAVPTSEGVSRTIHIENGRNTVLLCFRPSDQVPRLIVANPDR